MRNKHLVLATLAILLIACGADVGKKQEKLEVEEVPGNPFANTSLEGKVIGNSSGRYAGSDVAQCTSGPGGQQEQVKENYQPPTEGRAESGHFYLYGVRKYAGASTNMVSSAAIPVQSDAPMNVGLRIMNSGATQVIASSYELGAWRTWGPLSSALVGNAYQFKVDAATYQNRSASGPSDAAATLKGQVINALNWYLTSSNNAVFHLEYFLDSSMNHVMILTGITQVPVTVNGVTTNYRYEFEFGREAQPLKPLRCSGYNYPVLNKSSYPSCKSAFFGCSL